MFDPTIIDLRGIRARLGLSYERMGRLLGVSGRTVERMERPGQTSRRPVVAERLAQLAQIVDLGELVFTPDGWRQFLVVPQPRFDGRTAKQLLERGKLRRVLAALASDYEGAPT
jgi:transcriptional regulator with XRE-family HTH domain